MGSNKKKNGKHMDDSAAVAAAAGELADGADADARSAPRGEASYWLEQADDKVERLRTRWNETQAELERCEADNRELQKVNGQLRAQVTDLQAYIDGRKEHWAGLQTRIEQYEDTLAGMEQVVRDAEDKLSRKDGERELLSNRIIELERQGAELAGRLQERERAQREDERRLKQTAEELEDMRGEAARAERAAKEAAGAAEEQAKLCTSLERCVARRDKTIEELEGKLEEYRESAKAAALDAAQANAELDLRTAECAKLREELEEKVHVLDRTSAERNELEARANEASQRLAALERRGGSAADEVRSLRQELVAQQNLIGRLEAELDSKQSVIDALRQQADGANAEPGPSAAAASHHGGNATSAEAHAAETLSEGSQNVEIIRIGDLFRHDTQGSRQPIAVLEAPDGTTYPVTKASITIGRSSSNDICIRREFVSRTHARLIVHGIGAIIEDAGSKNGIMVNCEPVGRRLLTDGDIVSIGGKLDLKYVELDASDRAGIPASRHAEGET